MKACDVHCHFLPGVDDGPETSDEAVAMLQAAWETGTRALVATPHLYADYFPNADLATVRRTFDALCGDIERLAERPEYAFLNELELHLGGEHFCDGPFLDALERDAVQPIAGGRYLLIEFPTRLPEAVVHAGAVRVLQAGYTPILAHVERYAFVRDRPERLRRFLDIGCVTQSNVDGSHRFGGSARLQRRLFRHGLVHLLATDGHDVARRPPELAPGAERLIGRFTAEQVTEWAWDNPRRIVRGEILATGR